MILGKRHAQTTIKVIGMSIRKDLVIKLPAIQVGTKKKKIKGK